MFEKILSKYSLKDTFKYRQSENLVEKCNAPTKYSGVYLIFNQDELIYIGSSGQKMKNGKLKTRKSGLGGMKDRIVNGYHPKFGKVKRKKAFPENMKIENIEELIFHWYVTFDFIKNQDFPTDVENKLCSIYKNEYNKLPVWHKQKQISNKNIIGTL